MKYFNSRNSFFESQFLKGQELEFSVDIQITDEYVVFNLTGPSQEVEYHLNKMVNGISPPLSFKKDEYFKYPLGARFAIYIKWSYLSEDWYLKKLTMVFRYLASMEIHFDENILWDDFRHQSSRKAYELFLAVKKSKEREFIPEATKLIIKNLPEENQESFCCVL